MSSRNRCGQRLSVVWRIAIIIVALWAATSPAAAADALRPNIVFIMADDLGYGDLGCYGQEDIKTPHLDRLAADGMRFTSWYAGSTVCAPSRCALMTGLHTGHCRVRGNGQVPLQPQDVTVAEVLKKAGYVTGIFGKWGLGEAGSTGIPNDQGFDEWFGYLSQHHAHNYYPDFLWRNREREPIAGNVVKDGVATKRAVYSPDLFTREALSFLDRHKNERFFLYLPYTIPHANNEAGNQGMEVPSDEPYGREPWPEAQRNHAAMITRLDRDIGRIMHRLRELKLDEDTIVVFSSDNGPHKEGGADPDFFESAASLRGHKRDLYDGGIRVPAIVRWPGHVAESSQSDIPCAHWDVLPTLAELAGSEAPLGLDGISIVPTLFGPEQAGREQEKHKYLYWEFHERGFKQAVREGTWKAIRFGVDGPIELYRLDLDMGETDNLADKHPATVARLAGYMDEARTDSPDWPLPNAKDPSGR